MAELHQLFQQSTMSSLGHLTLTVLKGSINSIINFGLPKIPNTMLPVLHTLNAPFFCLFPFSVDSLRHISTSSPMFLGYVATESLQVDPLNLLYSTLSKCSHLETLHIKSFRYMAGSSLPTIRLPHFRRLTIEESFKNFEKCALIVQTLRIPPTALLEIPLDHYSPDFHRNAPSTLLAALSLRPLRADSVRIGIIDPQSFVLEAGTLCVRAGIQIFVLGCRTLAAYFAGDPGVRVAALECTAVHFRSRVLHVDWPVLLSGFARAVRLIVRGLPAPPLFDALAGGNRDSGGSGVQDSATGDDSKAPIPPCIALEEITYGWESGDTVKGNEPLLMESLASL